MSTAITFGGWIPERPTTTGTTNSLVSLVGGWVAATGGTPTGIGTGGELSLAHLQQSTQRMLYSTSMAQMIEIELIRTPSENLMRIREVLKPAMSDLATAFGVSRQSIYNWINGEPVAKHNASRLQDLAQAADVLAHERISVNAALLKRKFANGKTLMQVTQAGGSARDAALILVQIYKREATQRERMNTRFANRVKTSATADFDLPAPNDHA